MAGIAGMEDKLKALVNANRPENKNKWVRKQKNRGKRMMGLFCIYVPEEIISAAEILAWRIKVLGGNPRHQRRLIVRK